MKHYKDTEGNVFGYDVDQIVPSGLVEITKHEAEGLHRAKLAKEFDSHDWWRKRLYSYPEVGEFLDAWVKNDTAALEEYRQKCLAVKAQFPKPDGF